MATYSDLADGSELEWRSITTWNSLPLSRRRPAPRSFFSCLSCSPPAKLDLQLIDRFGTESFIGDVPCAVSVLCPLPCMQHPVRLVDLEPTPLQISDCAMMSASSNGGTYSCIIHHSSPSLLVDHIGTVDSAMTRTTRYVGLLDVLYMRTKGDHH